MKSIFFLLSSVAVILFSSCEKKMLDNSISGDDPALKTGEMIEVCHYDEATGTSHTIRINQNAWPAHEAHGDVLGECNIICDQNWMNNNLDVTTYRNGDIIPQVTDPLVWRNLTTGAWCYYNNDPANNATYGKLYNIYAVLDPRGLAPEGWRIPTQADWETLETCLGGDAVAGGPLKSTGTIEAGTGFWQSPNTGATNSTGFTGHPGGSRDIYGTFFGIGSYGYWWSNTQNLADPIYHFGRQLVYNATTFYEAQGRETIGFSVRCIRD